MILVPRYILLLKELVNTFPLDSQEIKPIRKVIGLLTEATDSITNRSSFRIAKRMVMVLQENLFGDRVSLMTRSRFCIRFGMLTKIYNKKIRLFSASQSSDKGYFFMLFNDCLCYASLSKDLRTGMFKYALPLVGMRIEDSSDSDSYQYAFNIESSVKSFKVYANSSHEKDSWIRDISVAIIKLESEYQRKRFKLKSADDLNLLIKSSATPLIDRELEFTIFSNETPWLEATR